MLASRLSRIWLLFFTLAVACFVATPILIDLTEQSAEAAPKKRKKKRRKKAKPPPPPEEPAAASSDIVPNTQFRGPTRIDFDDRLIQGQTNKSGAVYLFDRKETGISSMVRRRKSFRHLTIATIYDR